MYRTALGFVLATAMGSAVMAQTPPPASAFGRLSATVQAKISPNGQQIVILGGAPKDRTLSFSVIDKPGVNLLHLGDVETLNVRWVSDRYAVAQYATWLKDDPRNTYRLERNVAVTPDARVASFLLKADQISGYLTRHPIMGIVDGPTPRVIVRGLTLATGPMHDANTRLGRKGGDGDNRVAALLSVDPATGKGVEIERGTYDTESWEVDLQGRARVALEIDDLTDKYRLLARKRGETNWEVIQNGRDESLDFLGFAEPDDSLYFRKTVPGGVQVMRRSFADGAMHPVGAVVTAGDPWIQWDPYTYSVLGIGQGGDGGKVEWLDPDFAAIYATLSRALKGKDVTVRSWSRDRTRLLVTAESDDEPLVWYLYDRPRKELSVIGESYPELVGKLHAKTQRFAYKARDGLDIPAYLTLPSATPAPRLPLIVLPHDGPAGRDYDLYFDYLVQFLASRGYAVLRPQYRGSIGFGPTLEKAGEGEWGGKVQTDLLDGIAALAAAGTIDPTRVCIVGRSFGGYSALYGAVFQPQAYRCAASIAGISDLRLLISASKSAYGEDSKSYRLLRERLLKAAPEGLEAISPLKNAKAAGAPILLVHPEEDTAVRIDHAKRMAEALTKAGKTVELMTLPDENHNFAKSESRSRMLDALNAFLARNLRVSQVQAAR